jgi:hypothetical protein
VLTSKLLTPDKTFIEIKAMLQAAAAAALKMPQLKTLEIWNGRRGLAALFKYQAFRNIQQAVITWRGTWELTMEPSTIQAWEAVVHQPGRWRFDLVQESLDEAAINSLPNAFKPGHSAHLITADSNGTESSRGRADLVIPKEASTQKQTCII